jgi:DNA-binding Lrp family transcriptional regulator
MPPDEPRLAEIRKAVARGWRLIPVRGKEPFQRSWQKRPPMPLEQLLEYAKAGNIGLVTGQECGIVVLDDDTPDLSIAAQLNLPPTVTVRTGGGKRHYYFRHQGEPLSNRRGALPKGVDVRGTGGMVVFVGSVHPDTGGIYEWLPGHSPDEIEMAELPAHVIEAIRANPKRKAASKNSGAAGQRQKQPRQARRLEAYAAATLASVESEIRGASDGERNETLNRGAFVVGKLVGAGLLPFEHVEAELSAAAEACGLSPSEVNRTLRRALNDGVAQAVSAETILQELDANTLGLPPADQDSSSRPMVVLVSAERHHAVDATIGVLREQDPPVVFDQVGRLVCLVPVRSTGARGRGRTKSIQVRALDDEYLPDLLGRLLRFAKETENGPVPINCPSGFAKTVLARTPHGELPHLTGVICTPTLRPDGSLLGTPGYDPETGLYLDIDAGVFDGVPEHPTRDDALRALEELRTPFSEFSFETPADWSVLLAGILTPFVRWHLRTAPLFVITAPRRGSGKTLLARSIALIATGRPPWTMSQAQSEEEERKRWFSLLLAGASIVNVDNLEAPLGGATLCALLTEDRLSDRVLGASQVQSVDTTQLVIMATGNNVELAGDITRRVVVCGIDPGVEFPEDRTFRLNLDHYLLENRPKLVVAALTILRAYFEAGRPRPDVRPFGSFEGWSDLVRGCVLWLGEEDPCRNRPEVEERDPRRALTAGVLRAWFDAFGEQELTSHEVVSAASGAEENDEALRTLAILLSEVCSDSSGRLTSLSLGQWLNRVRKRVEDGLRVEMAGRTHGRVRWRARRV